MVWNLILWPSSVICVSYYTIDYLAITDSWDIQYRLESFFPTISELEIQIENYCWVCLLIIQVLDNVCTSFSFIKTAFSSDLLLQLRERWFVHRYLAMTFGWNVTSHTFRVLFNRVCLFPRPSWVPNQPHIGANPFQSMLRYPKKTVLKQSDNSTPFVDPIPGFHSHSTQTQL